MNVREEITLQLKSVVKELVGVEIDPQLTFPSDMNFGDYSTNVAMVVYGILSNKKEFKNPMELADKLATVMRNKSSHGKVIKDIQVVKPGFINFWMSDEHLLETLMNMSKFQEKEVVNDIGKGRPVVVEYSSPNIAKPFTIGHLRSTIIGDAVANLLQVTGWKVFRDNHVGDWGTQFGKLIYAVKMWGDEEELDNSGNPVKDLVALYVRFHQEAERDPEIEEAGRRWFKRLEDGDIEAKALWRKCVAWSWKEFSKIYDQLGVRFTENKGRGYAESYFDTYKKSGSDQYLSEDVLKELRTSSYVKQGEEGALLFFFPESLFPPLMILKKDGTTLYSTRDLVTDMFRLEQYGKNVVVINEVGIEQSLYFQQLYKIEELLGWFKKGYRVHVKHGLYRFKEGKMSTRKGNVIWLEDVLNEAIVRASRLALISGHQKEINSFDLAERKGVEIVEDTEDELSQNIETSHVSREIRSIAMGAIKWNDLKRSSEQDIVFDWDDVLSMDGNSGPYIQYAYARAQSVLQKTSGDSNSISISAIVFDVLNKEEINLLRCLMCFEDVLVNSAQRYAPNVLCTYLFELSQLFNLFYQKCPVLKAEHSIRDFRLCLTAGVSIVIKRGLGILGIDALESM